MTDERQDGFDQWSGAKWSGAKWFGAQRSGALWAAEVIR